MAIIQGVTVLLIFQLMGEVVSVSLGLAVPGPVIGLSLLFCTLLLTRRLPSHLQQAADGLLSHLSLLFVPAGVGLMVHFQRVGDEWLPIAVALLLSTVISLLATAWVMQRLLSRAAKRSSQRGLPHD